MKHFKRIAYLISAVAFSTLSLLAYSPAVHANSYFGGNGRLTFYSPVTLGDTTKEIYTVKPDGTDLKQITNNSLEDANPQWNPDADKIAFDEDLGTATHGHDIYIQAIDSTGGATGSAAVLSGADTCENEWDPSWSPDGTTIAYHRTSTVRNDCSVGDPAGPDHIFTIASDGSGTPEARTGLSSSGTCGGTCNATDAATRDTEATWNKDGDTLVFTRADTGDDSTEIATVPANGDEDDVELIPGSAGGSSPQWSPLDNTIVFKGSDDEIYTFTIGDSTSTKLTTGASIAFAPTFSPDGKIIAASGTAGIEYFNAATGAELTTVTVGDSLDFLESDGNHEIDWARADAPDNNTHDCTIYVNETCNDSDFDPVIPDICATGTLSEITTTAKHGTPSYSGGKFSFKPTKDYVGTDKYVYTYYDSNMNAITCTVNITVLPRAPNSGEAPSNSKGMIIGSVMAVGALLAGYTYNKKRFAKK